jgi:hypothetical protein
MGLSACKLMGSALQAFLVLVIPTMQSQQKVNMAQREWGQDYG